MSTKKRPARKSSRRRPKICMRAEDDVPLSLLALFAEKTPRRRKRSSPQKRAARSKPAATVATPSEIIELDDTPETREILNNVDSKIGNFMQSGSFISSDEDEEEMIKAKTNKKPSPNPFFISDDSDDECKIVTLSSNPSNSSNVDTSKPSTSTSCNRSPSKNKNLDGHEDNIMNIVDSILEVKDQEQSPLKDMKSLEDYRKETEEMLKNASSLLDEIKTGRKAESEEKREASSPKVTVGACPVCLESLANRPASVTVCGHIFCKNCIMQTAQTLKKCPTCRKSITVKKIHPIYF